LSLFAVIGRQSCYSSWC